ncbi:MAG: hypothetical protein CSB55_00040 [Candidatus Cloacimonadota bacterium]|nr:MAG: hypothetical protein CSB55_00040 [Candidatus Cloacimonadota bacterium]
MTNYHVPVLLKESLDALCLKPGGIYVDATLGGGGHTEAVLKADSSVRVYAFDQDEDAVAFASERLSVFNDRLFIIESNFSYLRTHLALQRIKKIDGILFDLGVSSHQLDVMDRGFSFRSEHKLDMRMNRNTEISAYDVVNGYSRADLVRIFKDYGEERESFSVAKNIEIERKKGSLETNIQLANLIEKSVKSPLKEKAKARIFQALRIEVNQETEVLKKALKSAVDILNPGGRIAVISYHSLEDGIVKRYFKEEEINCTCPSKFLKCVCNKKSRLKILTKKPIIPDKSEIAVNSRSRSAKLRIGVKK